MNDTRTIRRGLGSFLADTVESFRPYHICNQLWQLPLGGCERLDRTKSGEVNSDRVEQARRLVCFY